MMQVIGQHSGEPAFLVIGRECLRASTPPGLNHKLSSTFAILDSHRWGRSRTPGGRDRHYVADFAARPIVTESVPVCCADQP
jgi:hypothetical protein